MRCKENFVKLFAVLLLGIAAFSIGGSTRGSSESYLDLQKDSFDVLSNRPYLAEDAAFQLTAANRPPSPITVRLFQLMFILFFISPPIIAVLLFLIWKELKKRND